MKKGDLRRFKDDMIGSMGPFPGSTFMVLDVATWQVLTGSPCSTVDILIDGVLEEGLGYFWVEDSSEAVNEAG